MVDEDATKELDSTADDEEEPIPASTAPMLERSSIALAVSSVGVIEAIINCFRAMPIAAKSSCTLARMPALNSSKSLGRSKMLVMFSPSTSVMRLRIDVRR